MKTKFILFILICGLSGSSLAGSSILARSMTQSRDLLAKAACADDKYLSDCFSVKQEDCEKEFNDAYKSCLKMKTTSAMACTLNDLKAKFATKSKHLKYCEAKRIPAEEFQ